MPPLKPKHSVFISYCREDAAFAAKLRQRLAKRNLFPWLDRSELRGGDEWGEEIKQAIVHSSALAVVMSPPALKSAWVRREWKLALSAKVPVIPVIRRSIVLPRALAKLQWVDFSRKGKQWLRLVEALIATQAIKKGRRQLALRAEFDLDDDGDPVQAEGDEYVILLNLDNVPAGARKVRYQIHDESFSPSVWYKRNPKGGFGTSMQSYGDILLSAEVETPKKTHVVYTGLWPALLHTHSADTKRSIRSALTQIRNN